jgi:hypothetical protein
MTDKTKNTTVFKVSNAEGSLIYNSVFYYLTDYLGIGSTGPTGYTGYTGI